MSSATRSKERGIVYIPILVALVALVGFLLISSHSDFKDRLFATLFRKPSSYAAEIGSRIEIVDAAGNKITTASTRNVKVKAIYVAPSPSPSPKSSAKTSPCSGIGDVDLDGFVTSTDADLILKAATSAVKLTSEQTKRADVNVSNSITSTDSLLVSRYIQGLQDTFPACTASPSAVPSPSPATAMASVKINGAVVLNNKSAEAESNRFTKVVCPDKQFILKTDMSVTNSSIGEANWNCDPIFFYGGDKNATINIAPGKQSFKFTPPSGYKCAWYSASGDLLTEGFDIATCTINVSFAQSAKNIFLWYKLEPTSLVVNPSPVGIGSSVKGVASDSSQINILPTHFKLANSQAELNTAKEIEFAQDKIVDWTLSNGSGDKTVYAQFKINNAWSSVITATIKLNLQPEGIVLTKKALAVIYDPVLKSGKKLHEEAGWNDPIAQTNQIVQVINGASGGFVNYQVEFSNRNEWPPLINKPRHTEESYKKCKGIFSESNTIDCEAGTDMDYAKLWEEQNLCQRVSKGEVDTVFLYGPAYAGWDEFAYKIPGDKVPYSMPTNEWLYANRRYNIPDCNGKTVLVMGWIYQSGVDNGLHSFGHWIESALAMTVGKGGWDATCTSRGGFSADFDKFTCINKDLKKKSLSKVANCGNVHYPPNGLTDYDYANKTTVKSGCDSYQDFPFTTPVINDVNCDTWGCSQQGYLEWWMSKIPKKDGRTDIYRNSLKNWWKYIADFDNAVKEAKAGNISPCNGLGDVDLDGFVTNSDAELILKATVNTVKLTTEQTRRADVNASNSITSTDMLLILRYIGGLITTFAACPKI